MEEWERITKKKEFINELSNRENALLGSWMNLKEDSPMTIKLVNTLFEFDKQPTGIRKPYKIQSNAIQFDTVVGYISMIYQNAIDIIIYLSQSKKDTIIGTDFMYMILWAIE